MTLSDSDNYTYVTYSVFNFKSKLGPYSIKSVVKSQQPEKKDALSNCVTMTITYKNCNASNKCSDNEIRKLRCVVNGFFYYEIKAYLKFQSGDKDLP